MFSRNLAGELMARKNPFENLLKSEPTNAGDAEVKYVAKGATRSIMSTIDELADKADQLMDGETIVELDPALIDPSFIKDRLEDDEEEFKKLVDAVKAEGQSTPILVRPHPNVGGRYMVVFGARRSKVAAHLGIQVRAVIKDLSDRDHAVAQGQENAARANLSFIERAMLASDLVERKFDDDNSTVLSALSIDKPTLSKMLAVTSISQEILNAMGSAKSVGRDRWYELKILLDKPANKKIGLEILADNSFGQLSSDERFNKMHSTLKGGKKVTKTISPKPRQWTAKDKSLIAELGSKGKNFAITMKAKSGDANKFGEYLSENLDALYENFKNSTKIN